jgi:hypothetical protein
VTREDLEPARIQLALVTAVQVERIVGIREVAMSALYALLDRLRGEVVATPVPLALSLVGVGREGDHAQATARVTAETPWLSDAS